jgi:hypothetical protein
MCHSRSLLLLGRESFLTHNAGELMHSSRYFRHWLNIVILWSVWNEMELAPWVLIQHHIYFLGPHPYPESMRRNGYLQRAFGCHGG